MAQDAFLNSTPGWDTGLSETERQKLQKRQRAALGRMATAAAIALRKRKDQGAGGYRLRILKGTGADGHPANVFWAEKLMP
jgi:hypothetical protein